MKIILTIILFFFSFITQTFANTDIKLEYSQPCPPPYAPGQTGCHDTPRDPNDIGPKIQLKEVVITDDKNKFVKYVDSIQQMPVSFDSYSSFKSSDKVQYFYVNNFGELILFLSDGKYCNYTKNVCYENKFLDYPIIGASFNAFENKDFLFIVSFDRSKILIYSKEYNNFLNLNGYITYKTPTQGERYISSRDSIAGISYSLKNNVFDLYLKYTYSEYIGKFSFDLNKLKQEKKLFNSKKKIYTDLYIDSDRLSSGNGTFNGLVGIDFNNSDVNNNPEKIKTNSINVELINSSNTNILISDYINTYNVPSLNSKVFLFSDSSLYSTFKSYDFAGTSIYSKARLYLSFYINGQLHKTDLLGGSEDNVRSDIKLVDLNYSNGYYYITYDVANVGVLDKLFPGLYSNGDGKPIPGFYTIYTKDLANFTDAKILKGGYFLGYSNGITIFAGEGVKNLFNYKSGVSFSNYNNIYLHNAFTIFKDESGDLRFGYLYNSRFYISGEPILNKSRKSNIEGGENFGKDFSNNNSFSNDKNDLGGEKDNNGDYVIDKDRVFNSEEEYEKYKKKDTIDDKYSFLTSQIDGLTTFLNLFVITFPENYDKNLKVPFIKPTVVNGQPKIQYKEYETQLKPIEDKLNISLVGDTPDYMKKGLSILLSLIYISARVGIIFLNLIFFVYIYKFLNSVMRLVLGNFFNYSGGNVWAFAGTVGFLVFFFGFSATLLSHINIFTPFFDLMINFLNLLFGFLTSNFLDYQTFYGFTNLIGLGLLGILSAYLVVKALKTYGKIN